jgi:hypothetical protein
MSLRRALPFAVALALMPLQQAVAQFGGMPGAGGGFPGPAPAPAAPPPACQQLMGMRDEVHKYGTALQAASKRKVPPAEACRLFKLFIGAQNKMMKGVNDNGALCGVPPEVGKEIKEALVQYAQISKQLCDAAANAAAQQQPLAPSLSDALSTPVPDARNAKTGSGTFDTLTGNPLAR